MPELPEVETTRRGIEPALLGHKLLGADVREARLRWPVPGQLSELLQDQAVIGVKRRAKYLLIELASGHLIIHLGMSGRLRVVPQATPLAKHDHIDIVIDSGEVLRLNDPRRFGAVLWHTGGLASNKLLQRLGPEPLSEQLSGAYLHERSRGLKTSIKNFIMDQQVVVGVGNIYASESLFRAGIHPRRAAGRVSLKRYEALAAHIREVLKDALDAGGTTLRDYRSPDGAPGYFVQALDVYDKAGQDCSRCGASIKREVIGQRASYFCPSCQR